MVKPSKNVCKFIAILVGERIKIAKRNVKLYRQSVAHYQAHIDRGVGSTGIWDDDLAVAEKDLKQARFELEFLKNVRRELK